MPESGRTSDEPDAARFRETLGHVPTGVTVITAAAPDGPAGFAVGSFFSVSLDPLLVGFCAGNASSSWPKIKAAGAFCVNVLAADQEAVSRVFSTKSDDKFRELGWRPARSGSPRLDGVVAWIDCEVEAVHEAGDHDICIGRVRALGVERQVGPLVFHRGSYCQLRP